MKKKKTNILLDLSKEYYDVFLVAIKKLYSYLDSFANNNLNEEGSKEVILCEKKCDRLKEEYIKQLFIKKRALPFLIEDRYRIITSLDKIMDLAEVIVRFLEVYPFDFPEYIKKDFKRLNDLCLETIEKLVESTALMETDFRGAFDLTVEVQNIRREAYDLEFQILGTLYRSVDQEYAVKIYLVSKLIYLIYDIISKSEEFSDYLQGLIIKYPHK